MSENENVQTNTDNEQVANFTIGNNEQNANNASSQNSNVKKISLLWNSVPSFVKFCLAYGMIPTSFRLAMTYEEQVLWICRFLQETVIPSIEENGKAVEELQTAIIELENYINDLDVPQIVKDEIDQMIEDGDFDEIFAEYVDPKIDELQSQIDDITETIGNLNLPTVIDPETRRTSTYSYGRNT